MHLTWNCVLLCNNAQAAAGRGRRGVVGGLKCERRRKLLQLSLTDGVVPPSPKIFKRDTISGIMGSPTGPLRS